MGKRLVLPILLVIIAFLSGCDTQTVPTTPPVISTAVSAEPSPAATVESFNMSGEFVLNNTSTPGMEVGIETMSIVLEYHISTADTWEKIQTNCSFDPSAPFVLQQDQVVKYKCSYLKQPPPNSELRSMAEVKIFGNDEIFRLAVNSP